MATINKARIKSIFEFGLLPPNGDLGEAEKFAHESCITAASILAELWAAGDAGLDTHQLCARLDLNGQTIQKYCLLLRDLGLLQIVPGGGNKNIYLRQGGEADAASMDE